MKPIKRSFKNSTPFASKIIASGSYVPDRVVTNQELARRMPTSDAWIKEKIGITERRYAAKGQSVSDLALKAGKIALLRANLKPSDLDAIIFATATSEFQAPGSGVLLQKKLGCRNIPAFDVRNTSPGFLFSLELADGLVKTGRYRTVMVVGAELHSTVLDFSQKGRMMSVIFGDGAGCFIVQASKGKEGLRDFVLHSDGTHFDKLWYPGAGANPNFATRAKKNKIGYMFPQMDGKLVFASAVNCLCAVVKEILKKNALSRQEIDWFLCHQANLRILEAVARKLRLPLDRMPHNIEKYGNTSSASIPILFDELSQAGKFCGGQKILLCSFGSGFSWGAGLVEW